MVIASVYRAYVRGRYLRDFSAALEAIAEAGLPVRLGAYGDPAALPQPILDAVVAAANGRVLAYTHQIRAVSPERARALAQIAMISADSRQDVEVARSIVPGCRTFRVLRPGEDIAPDEVNCPASREAVAERLQRGIDKRVTCASCGLCRGTAVKARSIAIAMH